MLATVLSLVVVENAPSENRCTPTAYRNRNTQVTEVYILSSEQHQLGSVRTRPFSYAMFCKTVEKETSSTMGISGSGRPPNHCLWFQQLCLFLARTIKHACNYTSREIARKNPRQ